jgi:hypothetical protein
MVRKTRNDALYETSWLMSHKSVCVSEPACESVLGSEGWVIETDFADLKWGGSNH